MNIIGTAGIRIIPSMAGFGASVGAAIAGGGAAGALSRAGASASVLLTAPIIGGLAAGIGQAVSFESTFAEVRKTVNATDAEFARLSQGVIDMSKVMPFAREEINEVLAAAGRFGIANDDLLKFTELAIQMGVATGQAPQQVAEQVTRMMNILGVAPENFEKFFSSIVGLGNEFPTTEANIISMGTRLSQISAVASVSEADVLGMATALSSLGIRAEMGGSAMARVFFKMSDLTKTGGEDLEKFTEAFGLGPAEDFAKFYEQDAAGAVTKFLERVRDMNAEGKNVPPILKEFGLGEIRVRDTILRASQGLDTWNRAMGTADAAYESGTALQQEYNKRLETTASQWQIFKNRVGAAALTFGTALLPMLNDTLAALQPVIDLIAAGAEAFAMLDEDTRKTVIAFGLIVAAAGPLLWIGTRVVGMFTSLWAVFGLLGRGAMAHPVIAILTAIALIAILVITHWEEVRDFFADLWDDITRGAQGVTNFFDGFWGNLFGDDPDITSIGSFGWGETLGMDVRRGWEDFWGGVTGFWTPVQAALMGGGNWMDETFHHWVDPVADTFLVFWDAMGLSTRDGTAGIRGVLDEFTNVAVLGWTTFTDNVKAKWNEMWPLVQIVASNGKDFLIANVFSPLVDYWGPKLDSMAQLTAEAWSIWWPLIEETVATAVDGILSKIGFLIALFPTVMAALGTMWSYFDAAWQAMPLAAAVAVTLIEASIKRLKDSIKGVMGPLGDLISMAGKVTTIATNPVGLGRSLYDRTIGRFDSGGIVPGMRGVPQLALVHGGETILPTHKPGWSGGTTPIYLTLAIDNVTIKDDRDMTSFARDAARLTARELRAQGLADASQVVA